MIRLVSIFENPALDFSQSRDIKQAMMQELLTGKIRLV